MFYVFDKSVTTPVTNNYILAMIFITYIGNCYITGIASTRLDMISIYLI